MEECSSYEQKMKMIHQFETDVDCEKIIESFSTGLEFSSSKYQTFFEDNEIRQVVQNTLTKKFPNAIVFDQIRFIKYKFGAFIGPHLDLEFKDPKYNDKPATHSALLYLNTCKSGGETEFLERLDSIEPYYSVNPQKGGLVVFDRSLVHQGNVVVDEKSLLLFRCWISQCK
jgi:hypothetical protein